MRILFLDQTGNLGGAELCLADIAEFYGDRCLIGLFNDGPFRQLLEQKGIPVQILTSAKIDVRKQSGIWQGLQSLRQLSPLIAQITHLSHPFDLIYANTQKALVVGAIASFLSRRPLVYHLHDIVSPDHFSPINRRVIITLANHFAIRVIANSQATQAAFIQAGGRPDLTEVIYNGFAPQQYQCPIDRLQLREELRLGDRFVIGHFSRLSPWKGQHVLLEALTNCPANVTVLLIGDALFGEQEYVQQLHHQVETLGLNAQVHFLGFRSDIPQLMAACDLIAHTSTAPEPFGRVIVEAMLCGKPVVAAAAGGAMELVEHGKTGWLVSPSDPVQLAAVIKDLQQHSEQREAIAHQGQIQASRFHINKTNQQVDRLLQQAVK